MKFFAKSSLGLMLLAVASFSNAGPIITSAVVNGAQEVPPVATVAVGAATLEFDTDTNLVDVTLVVLGLSVADITFPAATGLAFGNAGPVHLHRGAPGTNGGIIAPFFFNNAALFMDITGGFMMTAQDFVAPPDFARALGLGEVYINVHTPANPTGEIRGQFAAVPEPASLVLLGLGALMLVRRRRVT